MANPTCMNITRKPVINVQVKLMPILFCPTWLATSGKVTPTFESDAGTSLMVPVNVPAGSPAFRASGLGALAAVSLSSALAAEGGGVAVDAGATACAKAGVHSESTI